MLTTLEPAELAELLARAGFEEIEDLGRREILEPVLGVPAKVAASLPGAGGGHLCRARRTSSA